jgi:hypothetical protein
MSELLEVSVFCLPTILVPPRLRHGSTDRQEGGLVPSVDETLANLDRSAGSAERRSNPTSGQSRFPDTEEDREDQLKMG